MSESESWQAIVANSLDWEQAHLSLDNSLKGLSDNLRGTRPEGASHSPWEILEHIRIAQADLLDFCVNPDYRHSLKWPDDYWPAVPTPPGEESWDESVTAIQRDRDAFNQLTTDKNHDLTAKIPSGTGQTYLRTILVAVDHTSYHLGEFVTVRRLLGAWPPK